MKRRRFVSTATLFLYGCGFRRGDRVLIPDGYVGWVEIRYNVRGAPQLRLVDGKYELRIGADGKLVTSSDQSSGYGSDEYFYVRSIGSMSRLQGGIMSQEPDDLIHSWVSHSAFAGPDFRRVGPIVQFFVGPRSALTIRPELPQP